MPWTINGIQSRVESRARLGRLRSISCFELACNTEGSGARGIARLGRIMRFMGFPHSLRTGRGSSDSGHLSSAMGRFDRYIRIPLQDPCSSEGDFVSNPGHSYPELCPGEASPRVDCTKASGARSAGTSRLDLWFDRWVRTILRSVEDVES